MGFSFSLCLILVLLPLTLAEDVAKAVIVVDGTNTIAETDENFICATLDWWPQDKCDYDQCPWGNASILNLDLSHPLFAKAVRAFGGLRVRIGGSLQDQVLYGVESLKSPCLPFRKMKNGLFGFSNGCLQLSRWDELNQFFRRTGSIVTFGLNALHGRHEIGSGAWGGAWYSRNAHDFIKYTVSKEYNIDSWEFGNELCGNGVGARVSAELYGKDVINLKHIIDELYVNSKSKPTLVAPGGFFEQEWFTKFLQVSGSGTVNIMTHHIYNLGPGSDPGLVQKILDPNYLNKVTETFSSLMQTIQQHGPWTSAWVGESGGAYNSGGNHVSDTFVNSFWYLDQLGLAAKFKTTVYCRQTLVGGNYCLLNTTTFVPNPDYYSALLWHRLMGRGVLAVSSNTSPYLRVYAHCSKRIAGITLLLINLSNQTNFIVRVQNSKNMQLRVHGKIPEERPFWRNLKRSVSWVGNQASDGSVFREEYHLSPKDGNIQSKTMVLNGNPLELTGTGDIPELNPVLNDVSAPIYINQLSISFIVFPNFDAPECV